MPHETGDEPRRRTDWGLILTAVSVGLALYGAAIRPLEAEVARQERQAATLAAAVLEQNKILADHERLLAVFEYRTSTLTGTSTGIKTR